MNADRMGEQSQRVLVLSLIGGTREQGLAVLSELLDFDLDGLEEEIGKHTTKQPHVQSWKLANGLVEAYLDNNRSLMYFHVPFEFSKGKLSAPFLEGHGSTRDALNARWHQVMVALMTVFLSSHIVMVLNKDTHLDVQLIQNLRTLQVFKNCLVPFVLRNCSLDLNAPPFSRTGKELRKWRKAMVPGYCEPQILCLFQTDAQNAGEVSGKSKALTQQITEIFERCNLPVDTDDSQDAWPLFNTHSRIKALTLSKLHTDVSEKMADWGEFLNEGDDQEYVEDDGMRSLKSFVHKRREQLRTSLKSVSFEIFPTASEVSRVWELCHSVLLDAYKRARVSSALTNDEAPEIPTALSENASKEEIEQNLEDLCVWFIVSGDPIHKISAVQCTKAFAKAKERYKKLVPDLYSQSTHTSALKNALEHYHSLAQGPAVSHFAAKLESECTAEWKNGRQQCEHRSLTGRACVRAVRVTNGDAGNSKGCSHNSEVEFKQASSTGMTSRKRLDPFSFLDANVTFYSDCTSDEMATFSAVASVVRTRKKGKSGRGGSKLGLEAIDPVPMNVDIPMVVQMLKEPAVGKKTAGMERFNVSGNERPNEGANECQTVASAVVHGWASFHRLEDASSYRSSVGIEQDGFLSGRNFLYLMELPVGSNSAAQSEEQSDSMASHFPPLSGATLPPSVDPLGGRLNTQSLANRIERDAVLKQWPACTKPATSSPSVVPAIKSLTGPTGKSKGGERGRRGSRGRGRGRGRAQQAKEAAERALIVEPQVEVAPNHLYVGLEYENLNGDRFFATSQQLNRAVPGTSGGGPGVSGLLGQDVPLFLQLPVRDQNPKSKGAEDSQPFRPPSLCQLQRIFIVTPPPPLQFAMAPAIRFYTSQSHFPLKDPDRQENASKPLSFQFSFGSELILPSESLCVVRLPFVYGVPGDWLGMDGYSGRVDCLSGEVGNWVPFVQTGENQPFNAFVLDGSLLYPL